MRLALAFSLCLIPAGAYADIRITSDAGGNVQAYVAKVQAVRASGERVIIDGPCNSACTLYLNLPTHQLCVTSRAVFGFHSATDSVTGLPDPRTNDQLLNAYPPHVRVAIGQRGGLWLRTIYIRGTQLARRCK